jgi:hypothetical protein
MWGWGRSESGVDDAAGISEELTGGVCCFRGMLAGEVSKVELQEQLLI